MPSIFGHVIASAALGRCFFSWKGNKRRFWGAGFCAFAPDLDVIGFYVGIPYGSEWGHRGFTHSIVFCLLLGAVVAVPLARNMTDYYKTAALTCLAAVSHPLLDMLTNGGLGCALWWPFSVERLFFPFRPVEVSPIGIRHFISPWGMEALASEILWIGVPCLLLYWLKKSV